VGQGPGSWVRWPGRPVSWAQERAGPGHTSFPSPARKGQVSHGPRDSAACGLAPYPSPLLSPVPHQKLHLLPQAQPWFLYRGPGSTSLALASHTDSQAPLLPVPMGQYSSPLPDSLTQILLAQVLAGKLTFLQRFRTQSLQLAKQVPHRLSPGFPCLALAPF
jgi:hypothetical protein